MPVEMQKLILVVTGALVWFSLCYLSALMGPKD
jgi:hypothetical protein